MLDLRKLFSRDERHGPESDTVPDTRCDGSVPRGEGLEEEYQALIEEQVHRMGVEPDCVSIEARKVGRAPDGRDVLVGMVRLTRWERVSGLRVLLGLPLLETRVRRMVRGTWLVEFSHFGGLWLHPSERLHHSTAASELRKLLMQLAPPQAAAQGAAVPDYGTTTNPQSLGASSPGEEEPAGP